MSYSRIWTCLAQRISLLLLLFFFSLKAHGTLVNIPWNCADNSKHSVPQSAVLRVFFGDVRLGADGKPPRGTNIDDYVDFSQVENLFSSIQENQNRFFDYAPCIDAFLSNFLQIAQHEFCSIPIPDVGFGVCNDFRYRNLEERLLSLINRYYTEVPPNEENAVMTPFHPDTDPDSVLSSQNVQDMLSRLRQGCGNDLENDFNYLSRQVLDEAKEALAGVEEECRRNITNYFAGLLQQSTIQNREACENHSELCRQRDQGLVRALRKLSSAGLSELEPISEEISEAVCRGELQAGAELAEFIRSSEEVLNCTPYAQNQARVVRPSPMDNSVVPRRYSILRLPNDPQASGRSAERYQVAVNLNIIGNERLANTLRERARRCYREVDDIMGGPNGERLQIRLYEDTDHNLMPEPPEHDIVVRPSGVRAFSTGWPHDIGLSSGFDTNSSDVECGVIIHETLHILGLCDEYLEQLIGYNLHPNGNLSNQVDDVTPLAAQGRQEGRDYVRGYTCRVPTTAVSVMGNHDRAIDDARRTWDVEVCNCGLQEPDDCAQQIADLPVGDLDREHCPGAIINWRRSSPIDVGFRSRKFYVLSNRNIGNGTILSDIYFRAILYPYCGSQGLRRFHYCQSLAYRTETPNSPCPPNREQICQGANGL